MRWLTVVAVVVVMTGCGAAQLEHAATFDCADVALGQSRTSTLQVVNHGPGVAVLELLSEGDEFSLEETSRTLAEGEVFAARVTFTPADLGPRTGSLLVRRGAASSIVALSGCGTGPRLSVRNVVTLAPIAIIDGQPLPVIEVPLVISNVGTTGSQLHVSLSANDNEVCVGSFDAIGTCTPSRPPPSLRAGERVTVPLSLLPTAEGVRTWRVTVSSDDPVTRAQVVTLSAVVERFVPCSFTGPFQVLLDTAPVPVTLTHHGAGPCLVRTATVDSMPAGAFVLAAPLPQVPVRVAPGAQFTVWVGSSPRAPPTAEGSLHVMSASGADREVHLAFKVVAPRGCLVVSPSLLDFGTARSDCAAASRTAQLSNTCSTPITLESVRVNSGPFVISNFPAVPTIGPGQSLALPVLYTPLAAGLETGTISVVVKDAETQVLALQGLGELATAVVDTFRDDAWPVVDVLVMVDTSPSFASKRAAVRANLASWLSSRFFTCIDARWAFAPADGAPDAGVAFALNDAGSAWTSRLESDFVGRALSAFDALPTSSETEACIGPAATLMQNVPARDGGLFFGPVHDRRARAVANTAGFAAATAGAVPVDGVERAHRRHTFDVYCRGAGRRRSCTLLADFWTMSALRRGSQHCRRSAFRRVACARATT
jgi:hypothetical protein